MKKALKNSNQPNTLKMDVLEVKKEENICEKYDYANLQKRYKQLIEQMSIGEMMNEGNDVDIDEKLEKIREIDEKYCKYIENMKEFSQENDIEGKNEDEFCHALNSMLETIAATDSIDPDLSVYIGQVIFPFLQYLIRNFNFIPIFSV